MTDISYANLEIGLSKTGSTCYRVEVRYWPLNSDTIEPPASGEAQLNPKEYLGLTDDAYGQKLSASLFANSEVHARFLLARQDTYAEKRPGSTGLRVRLWFDRGTEALSDLRWELLTEPQQSPASNPLPLSTLDLVPFSRFPSSMGQRSIRLRSKSQVRVLVVIASPNYNEQRDDGTLALARVDVGAEWDRVRTALGGLQPPTLLAFHPDAAGPPHRAHLLDALASGNFDIVYIVCHGTLDQDGPTLLLESDAVGGDVMPGAVLVEAVQGLPQPPRLMVLTACQSAGTGRSTANSAQLALGAQLVRAGVPAVLAMNGKVSQTTSTEFYKRFFAALQQTGCVDRAMTNARRTVKGMPDSTDWWMPVLYMRLLEGRIWYERGAQEGFDEWGDIMSSLRSDPEIEYAKCIPIIGPEFLESFLGPFGELAQHWAEREYIPFDSHNSELPQLAQYLRWRRSPGFVRESLMSVARQEVLRRNSQDVSPEQAGVNLDQLISIIGARRRQRNELDPYRILAQLPCPIYVTANQDSLLAEALVEEGKVPVVDFVRWNKRMVSYPPRIKLFGWDDTRDVKLLRPVYSQEPSYSPTVQCPLIFYLFGHFQDTNSLVLSEDDFFDYLKQIDKADEVGRIVSSAVDAAWGSNPLLFLGFNIENWDFRVLFRSIMTDERRNANRFYKSVAVQIYPMEGVMKSDQIRPYLNSYFGGNTGIYWGSSQDFLEDLWKLWKRGDSR